MIAAYALLYLWLMSRSETGVWVHVLRAVAFLPMNAAAATLAFRASQRTSTDPRIRRALRLIGIAYTCVFVGNVTAFYSKYYQNGNPLADWTNILYFGFYSFGLAGLLSMPLARRVRNEYWKFMLDAGTVIVGGGLAIWYLVIVPSSTYELDGFWGTFWALAYPIASLLLLLGVVTAFMRRPAQTNSGTPAMLLAGLLLYLASDLSTDITLLKFGWGSTNWTDVIYLLAYVVIAFALARYFAKPPVIANENDDTARSQPFTFLPYLSVAVCYGLLGVVAVRRWPEPMSVLAIGGIVITALVVIRQMAAVRENVRLLSEQSKRENEARFEALVQHSSDVITIVDTDTVIRYASPTVLQIFGHQPQELEGKRLAELVHPDDVPRTLSFFMSVLPPGAVTTPAEWRMRHHDGGWRDVEVIGTNLLDQPTVRGIVLNTRDISERKALQAELTHQAFHDTLTGLANRALFLDRVTHALVLARRHSRTIAVIFLDLDNFKTVNDSLGHAQGDMLLIHTSERMQTRGAHGGHDRPLRRRRVRDSHRGCVRQRCGDDRRRARAGAHASPLPSRREGSVRVREHRHRRRGYEPHRERSAAQRRHGDVHREAEREGAVPALRSAHAHGGDGAARARGRSAPRDRARRVHAALPADRAPPHRRDRRRRSARALESPHARDALAPHVHSARRGDGAHRAARPLGGA